MALTDIYRKIFGYDHLQDGTVIDLAEHGRAGADRDGQGFKFTKKKKCSCTTSSFSYYSLSIIRRLWVNTPGVYG